MEPEKTLRDRAEDFISQLVPDWRPTRKHVLWTVGIVAALVVAIIMVLGYVREWEWTGLVKDKAYTKRTLWDWLELLIIPAVLAGVGLWFNRQQRAQELQTADRRAQDEALQAYLDQMSAMLIPNDDQPSLSDEHPPDSLKTVGRARTLTVLPRLDRAHKARVVQFLYESGLIGRARPILELSGADLRSANLVEADLSEASLGRADLRKANLVEADLIGVDLIGANLIGADLSLANLTGADLRGAYLRETRLGSVAQLSEANLNRADLTGAYLSGANLTGADLSLADLRGADLSLANLTGADLRGANLNGANLSLANLSGANLFGAQRTTNEQLEQQARSLEGATMPNGQKYEDWLKSKGSGENGENSDLS